MTNATISTRLRSLASELDREGGQLFRVRAYRAAAFAIARLDHPLTDILTAKGRKGLEAIPGIGRSLGQTIEALLSTGDWDVLREKKLTTIPAAETSVAAAMEPAVSLLLSVDEEYRDDDASPHVLLLDRDGWRLRAYFANTALAHRLDKAHDWVVVCFERGDLRGQRTIVTETRSSLRGQRVVRGRESECRQPLTPAA